MRESDVDARRHGWSTYSCSQSPASGDTESVARRSVLTHLRNGPLAVPAGPAATRAGKARCRHHAYREPFGCQLGKAAMPRRTAPRPRPRTARPSRRNPPRRQEQRAEHIASVAQHTIGAHRTRVHARRGGVRGVGRRGGAGRGARRAPDGAGEQKHGVVGCNGEHSMERPVSTVAGTITILRP